MAAFTERCRNVEDPDAKMTAEAAGGGTGIHRLSYASFFRLYGRLENFAERCGNTDDAGFYFVFGQRRNVSFVQFSADNSTEHADVYGVLGKLSRWVHSYYRGGTVVQCRVR